MHDNKKKVQQVDILVDVINISFKQTAVWTGGIIYSA